jgi:hypothetical protein
LAAFFFFAITDLTSSVTRPDQPVIAVVTSSSSWPPSSSPWTDSPPFVSGDQ